MSSMNSLTKLNRVQIIFNKMFSITKKCKQLIFTRILPKRLSSNSEAGHSGLLTVESKS